MEIYLNKIAMLSLNGIELSVWLHPVLFQFFFSKLALVLFFLLLLKRHPEQGGERINQR